MPAQVTYKDRLSFVGSATEAEWKPIVRTTRCVPSTLTGMQEVAVNETDPSGVMFVMRPPDLRTEPQREEYVDTSNDDAKMAQNCERIRKVRREDLSEKSLAFWTALEQMHHDGRRAASVPSLPHTKCVDGHEFTFDGCPQPLRPLLFDLMRFERPLITWDIFTEAPPAEFRAPAALQLAGPSTSSAELCAPAALQLAGSALALAAPLAITYQPSGSRPSIAGAPDADKVRTVRSDLPLASSPVGNAPSGTALPTAAAAQKLAVVEPRPEGATSHAAPPRTAPELRDPRVANAVSHAGYPKSRQTRDEIELSFEAWTHEFPGRVEKVEPKRLYVVRLGEADGELLLGLVASEGQVFTRLDEATNEQAPHIKSLWFKRCSDSKKAWGANPEFEEYKDAAGKREQDLPTESFLLEVEDSELTDGSVEQKWTKPKFKQTLMRKLRWIAAKYNLQADAGAAPAAKRAKQR